MAKKSSREQAKIHYACRSMYQKNYYEEMFKDLERRAAAGEFAKFEQEMRIKRSLGIEYRTPLKSFNEMTDKEKRQYIIDRCK